MAAPAIPLEEFDQEMKVTRRVLERVPGERGQWKPHPKSFSLGHLAQLVARMPGWFPLTLRQGRLDLSTGTGYSYETTETLLATFDEGVRAARAALAEVTGDALREPWQLTAGDQVLMSLPRGEVTRQTLSHLVHHRGQLTVYLRLLDVPVPSVYGPTADEPWGAQG